MLHNNTFVKKTKKGQVLKVVREHYLRDDIRSGSPLDPFCPAEDQKLSGTATTYLVIDTNVALHQMDFLEHPVVTDVIVCSVVLEEVRHKNAAAYGRLRALCTATGHKRFFVFANEHHRETYITALPDESPNDRNDRAIRVATRWYKDKFPQIEVMLLTNDGGNRRAALADGLITRSVVAYARSRTDAPELADLVAAGAGEEEMAEDGMPTANNGMGMSGSTNGSGSAGGRAAKRQRVYPEHASASAAQAGLKDGRYHQGTLRVSRYNPFEGWVVSDSVGQDILISGRVDMNRAFDGDLVAVELLPQAQWRSASRTLPTGAAAGGDVPTEADAEDEEEAAEAAAGAELFQVAPGEHLEPDLDSSEKRPTGKVVAILKRNWRSRGYCGSLKPPSAGHKAKSGSTASLLFMPVERRFPMVRLQTRQADTLMDKRIVVVIDGWEADSMYPAGHYVRTLGVIGDRGTETEVLLIENDINTLPFTPAVHACVPPVPWSVTPADIADPNRMDLRDTVICSVDPPGCKDIDDALHVLPLPNGNYQLGVHIADVTHFLRPNTAMDSEAAIRATSCYLVERRIDMLPKPLTEDICSLKGGQERLAFSVLWEVTPEVHIVSTTFTRSVIRSSAALSYAQAQDRINDETLTDPISESLRTMNRLAKVLRQRRADAGALQLASPEVKFKLADSETQDPLDVGMYQSFETNQMVEEMMLLANIAVAEKIVRHFPSCSLLRHHQTPPPRQFEPLLKAAAAAGFTLDISSSKALAASLDTAVRDDDPYFNRLVRILATRCMTQALYFGSGEADPAEYRHYGLASPIYTHFTSPIRRYADVVVHRLLAAAIGLDPLPDSARDRASLRACSENLNTRHHNAQLAGRASVELHTLIFFKDRVVVADARVTKVKANGLIVFVPKYGIEGPVYLTPKEKDAAGAAGAVQYRLDEEAQTVTAVDGSAKYAIFDKCAVEIQVMEGQGHRRQLVLTLVGRERLAETDQVEV